MDTTIFSTTAIQDVCKHKFGQNLAIAEVVAGVETGLAAQAAVFKTNNGQLWLYIVSQGPQVLDDVQKIVARMNLEAELYCPPHGEPDYFARIGRDKFKAMFPGKPVASDEDLRYYKKLASYNPALVRLSKIKGEIRAYDSPTKSWRKVKDYNYSKIKTI